MTFSLESYTVFQYNSIEYIDLQREKTMGKRKVIRRWMVYVLSFVVVMNLGMIPIQSKASDGEDETTHYETVEYADQASMPTYTLGTTRYVVMDGQKNGKDGKRYFKIAFDPKGDSKEQYYNVYSKELDDQASYTLYDADNVSEPIAIHDYFTDNNWDEPEGEGKNFLFTYRFEAGKNYILEIDNDVAGSFQLCSQSAEEDCYEHVDGIYRYNIINREAIITGLTINSYDIPTRDRNRIVNSTTEVTIPKTLGGYPVVGMEGPVLEGLVNLKTLVLNEGIRYLDSSSITDTGLEILRLPEGLTHLYYGAIHRNYQLKDVFIPDSLTSIDEYNFVYDDNQAERSVSSKAVFHVSDSNQAARNYLRSLGVPGSRITSSMEIVRPEHKKNLVQPKNSTKNNTTIDNTKYSLDLKKREAEYDRRLSSKSKTVTIPNTIMVNGIRYKVTTVNKNALSRCKKAKKIVIGKNIKEIDNYAFKGTKRVKTIVIKTNKLTRGSVKKHAFSGVGKKASVLRVKIPRKRRKLYTRMLRRRGLRRVRFRW